ncbi:hypothetical protein [Lactococcus allomyrinae]|uniref:class III lanthionine synthetase LanKC N-terminal domain-containing protein n=1 Tax=Lactococcus allomyrinae TaxID=2419773 RepID=UPI001F08EA1A|nr:hypothetical protein [Lactococcus allomyrinae]
MEEFTYFATERYLLPKYGFKIHISATLESYEEVFDLTKKYLSNKELFYKYLSNRENFIKNISKTASPAESGKLFTIYPSNIKETEKILRNLSDTLKELDGIYILNDRNFHMSKTVFYRFGFFQDVDNRKIENKGSVWKDFQKTYFDLPQSIDDPFYQKPEIVEKESRPNILAFEGLNSGELRRKEFLISKLLNSNHFLRPVKSFRYWINNYYVYKFIKGKTLCDFQSKLFLFDDLTAEKLMVLKKIVYQLICILEEAHRKNIILDDIHPDNFWVSDDNEIFFIDLEFAHQFDEKGKITANTEGFYLEEWSNLTEIEKDLRKFGEVILFVIGQFNIFDKQERGVQDTVQLVTKILERFEINSNIAELLNYLFNGNSARRALEIAKKLYLKNLISFQ